MDQLNDDRPNLEDRRLADPSVTALINDLRVFRRRAAGELPRLMVVGDSSSRTVAYGLQKWAAQTNRAVVWSAGTGGCGIADTGEVVVTGRVQQLAPRCRDVQATYAQQVAAFKPDIVIVLSGVYDLQQRKLPSWSDFRIPGDPGFDNYLVQQYVHAYDVLSASGAHVLWFTNPCAQATFGIWPTDKRGGPFDLRRIQHVNEKVLPALAKQRPRVQFFDLYGVMCPHDKLMNSADGVKPLRESSVHFTPAGAMWFAEHYGKQILRQGLG